MGSILEEVTNEFMDKNPNIKIEYEKVPNQDILTKMAAQAQGDSIPDIVDGNWGLTSFLAYNFARDITDMMKAQNLVDQFIPAGLAAATNLDGKIYGMPFHFGTEALYYRTDYFKDAGLDPAKPPKTWNELAETAKKLTDRSKNRYGFGIYGKNHVHRLFNYTINAGPDGDVFEYDQARGKYIITFNSPAAQKGWQFLVDMNLVHKVVPPNVLEMDYPAVTNAFAVGNLAMTSGSPWGAETFKGTNKDIAGKFAVGPHPLPDDFSGTPKLPVSPVIYGVGRTTKYPEEAFKFLKWLCVDRNVYWGAKSGYGTVIKAGLDAPEIKSSAHLPAFMAQAQYSFLAPHNIFLKEWNKVRTDAIEPEFQAALSGRKSVKDATNDCVKKIKEIVGDQGELKYPV